ncbi:MAG TPA: NUDIX domain-containing protein [Candidatus Kapabacteria bacterium]|nr:NUDIX domain-containing protein [Candidatus Kapabacteria bacterium]
MADFKANTVQIHIARIIDDHHQFLILKRSEKELIYPNLWQTVTGTCRAEETSITSALREVYEETALKPIKIWTIPYVASFFDTKRDRVSFIPVFGMLVDKKYNVILSDEHSDYQWLTYEQILKALPLPSHIEGTKYFKQFCLDNTNHHLYLYTV